MNQKNSLDINICFGEQKNPIDLFKEWYEEAKKSEINDPNAVAVATSDNNSIPSVRMVLLKDFSKNGFIFYTNLDSKKSEDLKSNPNASMCFHWKSLLRQIRLVGKISEKGRHDPCVGIRAVPIGEAMMNCVLLDHFLMHNAQCKN